MDNKNSVQQSYAEDGIDKLLRDRFFNAVGAGLLVEVGAARPDYLSMSALFRNQGWRILSVEPNPAYKPLYDAKGYEMIQCACGDHDEDDVDFSIVDSTGANYRGGNVSFESWSSLSVKENYAGLKPDLNIRKIKVNLRRLDTIIAENAPTVSHIDVISVDVEGWEMEVLSGLNFAKYTPTVLVIENLFIEQGYRRRMKALGYHLWKYIPPNEIYIRPEMIGALERFVCNLQNAVLTAYWRLRRSIRRLITQKVKS